MRDLVVSPAMGVSTLEPCGVDARIAPPFMEATPTDASRLVCVVVVSYQEYSLTHSLGSVAMADQMRTKKIKC